MGSKSKAGVYVQFVYYKKTGCVQTKTKKRGGSFGKKWQTPTISKGKS